MQIVAGSFVMRKKKTGGQPKYATIGKYYASLKNNEVDVKKKRINHISPFVRNKGNKLFLKHIYTYECMGILER